MLANTPEASLARLGRQVSRVAEALALFRGREERSDGRGDHPKPEAVALARAGAMPLEFSSLKRATNFGTAVVGLG